MHPLLAFKRIFPARGIIFVDELRYKIRFRFLAKTYEKAARWAILQAGLPLVAMTDEWWVCGRLMSTELVIRMVPEMDVIERAFPEHSESCGDEVQDFEQYENELEFE